MSTTYIKADLPGFSLQLSNFSSKLTGYKTVLDITENEINNSISDAAAMQWVAQGLKNAEDYHRQWTSYKDLLRNGCGGDTNTAPAGITQLPAPLAVPPNIQQRFGLLVARMKKHASYTDAIGKDLDIISPQTTLDTKNVKPLIKLHSAAVATPPLSGPRANWTVWKSGKTVAKDLRNLTRIFFRISRIKQRCPPPVPPSSGNIK